MAGYKLALYLRPIIFDKAKQVEGRGKTSKSTKKKLPCFLLYSQLNIELCF